VSRPAFERTTSSGWVYLCCWRFITAGGPAPLATLGDPGVVGSAVAAVTVPLSNFDQRRAVMASSVVRSSRSADSPAAPENGQ
jgi:hypothetical protein